MEEEKEEEPAATGPGHPALPTSPDIQPQPEHSVRITEHVQKLNPVSLDIRLEARTSGSSRAAGHPAPSLDIRTPPI